MRLIQSWMAYRLEDGGRAEGGKARRVSCAGRPRFLQFQKSGLTRSGKMFVPACPAMRATLCHAMLPTPSPPAMLTFNQR
jgi:hypothetical protein